MITLAPSAPAELWCHKLSPRRAQVLELAAEGLTERQIAEQLVITPNTVKKHITAVHKALGVHSRIEAARWWWEHVELAEMRQHRTA